MTTLAQVCLVLQADSLVLLDLWDTCWDVPIHLIFRDWLGFVVAHQAYQFQVLTFGLNLLLQTFSMLVNVMVLHLQLLEIYIFAYIDNWMVLTPSLSMCLQSRDQIHSKLTRFGFLVNWRKSYL